MLLRLRRDRGSSAAAPPLPVAWPTRVPLRSRPDRSSRVNSLDGIARKVETDWPELVGAAGIRRRKLTREFEAFVEIVDIDDVEAEKLLFGFRERSIEDEDSRCLYSSDPARCCGNSSDTATTQFGIAAARIASSSR